ncbi:hypothetical protein Tco_0660736 [Tanacetum coccineum]
MVNTSLKELKRYLTGFDQVVKERTTATAITEGTWGFEHTKACFRDEIIPFIKNLKDIFNNFNRYLVEELADVQKVFYQMEQAVEQHRLESRTFEVKMNQVLSENERLLAQAIDKDIVKTVVNLSVNASGETVTECQKCLELETELVKKKDFVDKETYDKLCKCFTTLEKHCITLEADSQLNHEIFQQENSVLNQNAPSFTQLFELSELKAQSQAKDTVIVKLKEQIKSLSGNVDDSKVKIDMDEIETLNIELEHRVTKRVAENEHLKQTYKQLYDSDKPKRVNPKNNVSQRTSGTWTPVWLRHMTGDRSQVTIFISKFLGTVKFGNDQVAKIMGFGDYQIGNVTISRVYYVEGLGHNLFSVGQFCDSNLEVAFRQHTIEAMQEIFMNFKSGGWDFVSPPDKAFGHLSIGSKGLQISQSPRGIFINQSKYALESLKKYGYESCDPVDTPMVEKSKLDEDKEGKAVDPSHYRGMIGTLPFILQPMRIMPVVKIHAVVTSGPVYNVGDKNLLSWSSKRQKKRCISSTETNIMLCPLFSGRERIEFLINKLGMRSFTPDTLKQLADEVDE